MSAIDQIAGTDTTDPTGAIPPPVPDEPVDGNGLVGDVTAVVNEIGRHAVTTARAVTIIDQAHDRAQAARDDLADALDRLQDLIGGAKPTRRSTARPRAAAGAPSIATRIMDALLPGPATTAEIAGRAGLTTTQVSNNLTHLRKRNQVERLTDGRHQLKEAA